MADVFVSYAREDRARAEQIVRGLQAMGLECFWDTEIPPGQTWSDYIEGKLSVCKAVVVLWSAHSTGSQWVREEARMGRDKGKLIPAMLDNSPAPFGFGEVQAANLSTWRGEANHGDWMRFAGAVDAAVRGPDAAPRPAPQAPPAADSRASSRLHQASTPGREGGSPIGYISKCFRLFFNGTGRARRAEFGWFALAVFVALIIAAALDLEMFGYNPYTGQPNYVLSGLLALAAICPMVSAASRRAHDIGQSGWLAALTLIPYLGFVATLAFVFIPGQPGENKYGPDPKAV